MNRTDTSTHRHVDKSTRRHAPGAKGCSAQRVASVPEPRTLNPEPLPRRRRGTVLVFVMAVLVLLALLGLGMMIATRGERKTIAMQREDLAYEAVADRAVDMVRETLRQDIWGRKDPNLTSLVPFNRPPVAPGKGYTSTGDPNSNEAYDAPGPEDRWLSATLPYFDEDVGTDGALVWSRVSYLGPIANEPIDGTSNPGYPWDNPLDANSLLRDLILLTPTPADPNGSIPDANDPNLVPGNGIWDVDGNLNLDLYDADGDGIPDSPISFVFPVDTPTPSPYPKRVYVAIRVVDNASKLNVNVAGSWADPWESGFVAYFNESTADRQLRGRRVTELMLPALAKADLEWTDYDKWNVHSVVRQLRKPIDPGIEPATADDFLDMYRNFYAFGVRQQLVGGVPPPIPYLFYGFDAEASLTHRFCLMPEAFRYLASPDLDGGSGRPIWTGWIDRDLYGSLSWSRLVAGSFIRPLYGPEFRPESPPEGERRWWRFYTDDGDRLTSLTDPNLVGWQALLDPSSPWVLKRCLMTTNSAESDRRLPNFRSPLDLSDSTDRYQVVLPNGTYDRRLCRTDLHLAQPALAGWPTQAAYAFPVRNNGDALAGLYDYEKVSLNYPIDETLAVTEEEELKADYVTMLAWAFYVSGAIKIADLGNPVEAWQAAVNVCDYRDADSVPTIVKDDADTIIAAGLERQPFITEVHIVQTYVDASTTIKTVQVELYNPYGTQVGAANGSDPNGQFSVYIRPSNTPVSTGLQVAAQTYISPAAVPDPALDPNFYVELVRTMPSESVVCDRFRLIGSTYVTPSPVTWTPPSDPATPITENYQRDTNQWRFTTAKSAHAETGTGTLAAANGASLGATIAPSHWVVRDTGMLVYPEPLPAGKWISQWWTFDTPGELSRVLTWSNSNAATAPATELLAIAQNDAGTDDLKMAAGRLNFFRTAASADPNVAATDYADPRNIFGYVTATGANHDGIDNDGTGTTDEGPVAPYRSEAARINYLRAGRINVNTAPLPVLYTVPAMAEPYKLLYMSSTSDFDWDIAAGIVTLRERRVVKSRFGEGGEETSIAAIPDPDTDPTYPKRYQTVGDLADVTQVTLNNDPRFAMDRYGLDTTDLPAHDLSPDPLQASYVASPDYDATAAAAPDEFDAHDGAVGVVDDIRERDVFLARFANVLTTRSDVYTVYVALIGDDGRYLRRCQFTLDRTNCFADPKALPTILGRVDTNYYDDTR